MLEGVAISKENSKRNTLSESGLFMQKVLSKQGNQNIL